MQIIALFFTAASIADANFITLGYVKFTSAFNHLENCHYSYEATCPIAYPLGHFQNMIFVATKLQLPFVSWYTVNHFPVTPVVYLVTCRYPFKNFADFQKAFSSVLRLRNSVREERFCCYLTLRKELHTNIYHLFHKKSVTASKMKWWFSPAALTPLICYKFSWFSSVPCQQCC